MRCPMFLMGQSSRLVMHLVADTRPAHPGCSEVRQLTIQSQEMEYFPLSGGVGTSKGDHHGVRSDHRVPNKQFDKIQQLEDEWRAATEGKRTLRRSIVVRDRTDPERHLILAFFDSYEAAMENSNLPETSEFSQKQAALLDGPLTFQDLDVIEDRS